MRAAFCIYAFVGQAQPLHWTPADEVFLYNLHGIPGLYISVPDALGIDHYGGSVLALVETACLVDPHLGPKACGFG